MSHPSSTFNFEPADPCTPASSADDLSVFPLPTHASTTSTLGVPGSYADPGSVHTLGSRPNKMDATLLPQPVMDLVAWLRHRYVPQDLAIPDSWDQQLAALIDCLLKSVDDPDATTAFAWFLHAIRDLDSSKANAHQVKERETQRLFELALTYKSRLEIAGPGSGGLPPSAPRQSAPISKRGRQQYFSPESSVVQRSLSAMKHSEAGYYLGSSARPKPATSPKPSLVNVMTPGAMGSTPVSRSLEAYEQSEYASAGIYHLGYPRVADPALVAQDCLNPGSSVQHALQSQVADTRARESLGFDGEADRGRV
jgi:hypothetical protein